MADRLMQVLDAAMTDGKITINGDDGVPLFAVLRHDRWAKTEQLHAIVPEIQTLLQEQRGLREAVGGGKDVSLVTDGREWGVLITPKRYQELVRWAARSEALVREQADAPSTAAMAQIADALKVLAEKELTVSVNLPEPKPRQLTINRSDGSSATISEV